MLYLNSRKINNFWGAKRTSGSWAQKIAQIWQQFSCVQKCKVVSISDTRSKEFEDRKISKSGHPKMQNPIMLFLVAPPGNSYKSSICSGYINFVEGGK